jgi:hypothetical protein
MGKTKKPKHTHAQHGDLTSWLFFSFRGSKRDFKTEWNCGINCLHNLLLAVGIGYKADLYKNLQLRFK